MPTIIREKYSGGPNLKCNAGQRRTTKVSAMTAIVPAIKEPKAAIPRAGPALPFLGHLMPVQAGDHRGRLTRDIHQDGSGRAAVHGAVIDPGQHDDRGNRGDLEGGGKEQGNGSSRAETGQNTHQRPDKNPEETVDQIDGL